MSYGWFGREVTLDDVAAHRWWFFLTDKRPQDVNVHGGEFGINVLLATVIVVLPVFAALGVVHWAVTFVAVACALVLWRNWRRFNERLFHALAERDRAGIEPPIHPDAR